MFLQGARHGANSVMILVLSWEIDFAALWQGSVYFCHPISTPPTFLPLPTLDDCAWLRPVSGR